VYWSTFNSIEGAAFKGYFKGEAPPGIKKDMQLTQKVMANMLEAHVRVYQTIHEAYKEKAKTNPALPKPQVGIQKNIIPLDPIKKDNIGIRSASAITSVMGEMLQNQGFFNFFTTNTYSIYVPFYISYSHTNQKASESLDWIGVNIYSNIEMRLTAQQNEVDEDKQTENTNYRDYPEGIYRAVTEIKQISDKCHVPIIVTENGIATQDNQAGDEKRTRFFRRTLYIIRKLLDEHCPIIGYLPWSAHDNYEWPIKSNDQWLNINPFTSRRYGFFRVEFDKSKNYLERSLKKGSEYYKDFIKNFKTKIPLE
jgi:beta-glucosidase/6-phospho-beta-glucosidase/beta-galactosidase